MYDATSTAMSQPEIVGPTVDLLVDLAAGGPALEFAIGTGRIGIPLSERGVEVSGIEISTDMIAGLRRKPGGDRINVTIGDMATSQVGGQFALVYLVFNTIGNLLDQAEQVACFRNAARHLVPTGVFVVELEVPQLRRIPPGSVSHAFEISPDHVGVDTYDFANQRLTSHHYWPRAAGPMTSFDSHGRYVWPAELDLMAELAGMRLRNRWADWNRAPFTGESTSHISVWAKQR